MIYDKYLAGLKKYGGFDEEFMVVGVRKDGPNPEDTFCDLLGYKFIHDVTLYEGITRPSIYWTKHHMAPPHGAAIVMPGFHPRIWQAGMHYNQHALIQTGGAITICRDDNDDQIAELDEVKVSGYWGINCHTVSSLQKRVGQWSAGCMVVADPFNFTDLMETFYMSSMYRRDKSAKVSLLLLTEADIQ